MEVLCIPGVVQKKYKIFKEYRDAGFTEALFDLSAYCLPDALEHREVYYEMWFKDKADEIFLPVEPERMEELVSFYLSECEKTGVRNDVAKAPYLPDNSKRTDSEELIFKLTAESIRICGSANCKFLIVFPIIREMKTEGDWEKNLSFYLSLAESASANNLQILIPNHYDDFNNHVIRGNFSDPYALKKFIGMLNQHVGTTLYGLAMDIGVCNLCGQNMFEFTQVLKEEIKVVLLKENNGYEDSNLMPFTALKGKHSKLDWLQLIRGLRAIGFDGPLICDFSDTQAAVSHMLRPSLIRYEKELADFLAWQISMEQTIQKYEKRVLFGAGNMCLNYLKCYGEAYPPLFTCDNNPNMWNTKIEGLLVKNPEELKHIPTDCAIFICNIFYKEVKAQIEAMGIQNPVECFNDEYLPIS